MDEDEVLKKLQFLTVRTGLRVATSVIIAAGLMLASTAPVGAVGIEEYFSFSTSVTFSSTTVQEGQTFYVTVTVQAICNKTLPVAPTEAFTSGRVIARHDASGAMVILNPSYSVSISPVPYRQGETIAASQIAPLRFPPGSPAGSYTVTGELVEAKVKVLGIPLDIKDYLPQSQVLGSVTYGSGVASGGISGEFGGWGVASPPAPKLPPGTTDISKSVSANGTFTETVVTKSENGKASLTFKKGTKGLTGEGNPTAQISIIETSVSANWTGKLEAVGQRYDLGPDGAVFDTPVALTISYDEAEVPDGVPEKNLTIAFWDNQTSQWVVPSNPVLDTEANTITASISHFTVFAITADTSPTVFTVSNLSIVPGEVDAGRSVLISAVISNKGGLSGSHEVVMEVDGNAILSKKITLAGGEKTTVMSVIQRSQAGVYTVNVGNLSGKITVRVPPLPDPSPPAAVLTPPSFSVSNLSVFPRKAVAGRNVTVSVVLANTGQLEGSHRLVLEIDAAPVASQELTLAGGASKEVIFTISKDDAGTYAINIGGLSDNFSVEPLAMPSQRGTNWGVIRGFVAGGLALILIGSILLKRRRGL
ncbi:MAG: hypothetical protein HYX83_01665 [Chloroflexi bacterium]|nr:hypothetical protein [Chloroflexota bacterium]